MDFQDIIDGFVFITHSNQKQVLVSDYEKLSKIGEMSVQGIQKKLHIGNLDGREVLEITDWDNATILGWLGGALVRTSQQWIGNGKSDRASVIAHLQLINSVMENQLEEIKAEIENRQDETAIVDGKQRDLNEFERALDGAKKGVNSLQGIYANDLETVIALKEIGAKVNLLYLTCFNLLTKIKLSCLDQFSQECVLEDSDQFSMLLERIASHLNDFVSKSNPFLQVWKNEEIKNFAQKRSTELDHCSEQSHVLPLCQQIENDVEDFMIQALNKNNEDKKYRPLGGKPVLSFEDYKYKKENLFIYLILINNSKILHCANLIKDSSPYHMLNAAVEKISKATFE